MYICMYIYEVGSLFEGDSGEVYSLLLLYVEPCTSSISNFLVSTLYCVVFMLCSASLPIGCPGVTCLLLRAAIVGGRGA